MLLGALGVFVLPWYFPSSRPVWSLSYEYGFNNPIAWFCVVASAGILCLLAIFTSHKPLQSVAPGPALIGELLEFNPAPGRNRQLRRTALLVTAIATLGSAAWLWVLPYSKQPEMIYFVDRMRLMALGHQPYSSFDFLYGPLLIYPQFWLYKLGGGTCSMELAYATIFLIHVLLGLAATYFVFAKFGGRADTSLPFVLIVAFFILCLPDVGLNYTLLRFIVPFGGLVFFHTRIASQRWLVRALAAPLFALFALLLSPEFGIAALVTLTCYLVLRKDVVAAFASFLAVPAVVWLAGTAYLDGARSFAGGAANFPIFPTAQMLFFLTALAVMLPSLARLEWNAAAQEKGIAGALIVLTLVMVPGALGRADPAHIYFNELGFFILTLAAGANARNVLLRRLTVGTYAFAAIALPALIGYPAVITDHVLPAMRERWGIIKEGESFLRNPEIIQVAAPCFRESKPLPRFWRNMLEGVLQYGPLALPLGSEPEVDRYLKTTGRYVHLYQVVPTMILTRAAMQRQLRELGKVERVLVPRSTLAPGSTPFDERAYNEDNSRYLSHVYRFPISFRSLRNRPFDSHAAIAEYIRRNFVTESEWRHYLVLARRADAPGEPRPNQNR